MPLQQPFPIAPPPLTPPPTSLVVSAGPNAATGQPEHEAGGGWLNGVVFAPETCHDVRAWWDCYGQGGSPASNKDIEPGYVSNGGELPDQVEFHPWFAWAGDSTTTLSLERAREGEGRALRSLDARESKAIAREFWRGDIAQTAALPNIYLSNPTGLEEVAAGTAQPYLPALTLLQQFGAERTPNRLMIHCTQQLATLWQSEHVVRWENGLLLDLFGNIVVADAGYDGSGPGVDGIWTGGGSPLGQYQWAYVTETVAVWRGQTQVLGGFDENTIGIEENTIAWIAERPVMVTVGPCCRVGVKVDMFDSCGHYMPGGL